MAGNINSNTTSPSSVRYLAASGQRALQQQMTSIGTKGVSIERVSTRNLTDVQ
jgi:hypothetical protein